MSFSSQLSMAGVEAATRSLGRLFEAPPVAKLVDNAEMSRFLGDILGTTASVETSLANAIEQGYRHRPVLGLLPGVPRTQVNVWSFRTHGTEAAARLRALHDLVAPYGAAQGAHQPYFSEQLVPKLRDALTATTDAVRTASADAPDTAALVRTTKEAAARVSEFADTVRANMSDVATRERSEDVRAALTEVTAPPAIRTPLLDRGLPGMHVSTVTARPRPLGFAGESARTGAALLAS